MRIAVLLKEVPDTYSDREMNLETGLTDRTGDVVADEVCERAVEAALRIAEQAAEQSAADPVDVHVLSVGPASAADAVRRGIAMGASEGFLVSDEALVGADATLTAEVLAALVRRGDYDLVITGAESSDGGSGVIAPMVAELLDWAAMTNLTEVAVDGGIVEGTQAGDGCVVKLKAQLPAVVAVSDEFPDARFPNFKGLMAAKKKELNEVSLADLGVDPSDFSRPRAIMVSIDKRPARERGEIIDAGPAAVGELVNFLDARGLL